MSTKLGGSDPSSSRASSSRASVARPGRRKRGKSASSSSTSLDRWLTKLENSISRAKENAQRESSQSGQPRSKRRKRGKDPLHQRRWVWVLVAVGVGISGASIYTYRTLQAIERDLPDAADILTYVRNGTLTIKADDGSVLQQLGPATRDRLTFDQIPPQFAEAFIAAEDGDFYEHGGIDYQAIARATLSNILAGQVMEGGSTITQQVARIVFLDQERTIHRKIREALLAQKIEREISKRQILERYLNLVYLGSGAYGIADAAWIYFSKTVDELTLSEMAMIAGLPPAPSAFSPLVNLEAAERRRALTLRRMVSAGFITEAEMTAALAEPLEINPSSPKRLDSETPYFTTYIRQQLPQVVSPEDIEIGGLTVETTLNLEWQKIAEETVRNAIEDYGVGQGFEQAALVSVDPRSGEIKAMVGGDDFGESQFNRVTQAQRQPGSTFKTFVYAAAIAAGFSPYKPYEDAKFVVDGYEPQNYGRTFRGTVEIRDALIASVNVVAVKALIDVGFEPVIEVAQKMGIRSNLLPTYSLALGASEVNLLELTSAYGTLATQGEHIEAHGIVRVFNRRGELIYEAEHQRERALDADSAAIMSWMLQGVVQGGTGSNAQIGRPVAGKTGTSEERRDLWFVGYIPQLVTGVWLGNDDNQPTYGASSTAALTWGDFMSEIVDEMPVEEFPELPRLSGREGSIEAQPVKPNRVTASSGSSGGSSGGESRSSGSSRSWNDDAPPPRSSRSYAPEPEPEPEPPSRRESWSEPSRPPRQEWTPEPEPSAPVYNPPPEPAAAEPPPPPPPPPPAEPPPPPPPPVVAPVDSGPQSVPLPVAPVSVE